MLHTPIWRQPRALTSEGVPRLFRCSARPDTVFRSLSLLHAQICKQEEAACLGSVWWRAVRVNLMQVGRSALRTQASHPATRFALVGNSRRGARSATLGFTRFVRVQL